MTFLEIKQQITAHQERILMGVPKGIQPTTMLSSLYRAIGQNTELQKCSIGSLLGACIVACDLGLMPDGVLGEGYFKARKNRCQFLPGYKGLERLAYRTGNVLDIDTETVYLGDEFSYSLGTSREIHHLPLNKTRKDQDITDFYAEYVLTSGYRDFKVLTRAEVDSVRTRYQVAGDPESAWLNYYPKMGEKTAVIQLLKHANLSTDINYAIGLIETNIAGKDQQLNLFLADVDDNLLAGELLEETDDHLQQKAEDARKRIYDNANKFGKKLK